MPSVLESDIGRLTMKRCLITFTCITFMSQVVNAAELQAFKSPIDKVNYGIGVEVVRNFKSQGIEVDLDLVIKGMKDGLSGTVQLPEKELRRLMSDFQSELRRKQAAVRKITGMDNRKSADAFMNENKNKEGVVTTPNGLQYKIIRPADGKRATEGDVVQYNYHGTLINGTVFESNRESGKPGVLKIADGLIPGLREGLKLMNQGSKWIFFIPPQLAYSERGLATKVGPNDAIIFEIELLEIGKN